MPNLSIRWARSQIGSPPATRRVIRALGLRRLGHTVVHADTPSVRGMLFKVRHLVEVSDAPAAEGA